MSYPAFDLYQRIVTIFIPQWILNVKSHSEDTLDFSEGLTTTLIFSQPAITQASYGLRSSTTLNVFVSGLIETITCVFIN